jgi:hypothetical protein
MLNFGGFLRARTFLQVLDFTTEKYLSTFDDNIEPSESKWALSPIAKSKKLGIDLEEDASAADRLITIRGCDALKILSGATEEEMSVQVGKHTTSTLTDLIQHQTVKSCVRLAIKPRGRTVLRVYVKKKVELFLIKIRRCFARVRKLGNGHFRLSYHKFAY